jgi:preprotein translocase subunit SecD
MGPSLGEIRPRRGIWATIIAFASTIAVHGVDRPVRAGSVANIAPTLDLALILATLALFQATLALPAPRGIILTIGMAARREHSRVRALRVKRSARWFRASVAAMEAGYDRAFITIFDADITHGDHGGHPHQVRLGSDPRLRRCTLLAGIVISMSTALFGDEDRSSDGC